jgi:hypothetical protein
MHLYEMTLVLSKIYFRNYSLAIKQESNLYSFLSKKSKSVIRVLKYDIYFQICERIYLDIVKFYHFLEYYFRLAYGYFVLVNQVVVATPTSCFDLHVLIVIFRQFSAIP